MRGITIEVVRASQALHKPASNDKGVSIPTEVQRFDGGFQVGTQRSSRSHSSSISKRRASLHPGSMARLSVAVCAED